MLEFSKEFAELVNWFLKYDESNLPKEEMQPTNWLVIHDPLKHWKKIEQELLEGPSHPRWPDGLKEDLRVLYNYIEKGYRPDDVWRMI